jgi:hypothetical protein
MKNIEIFRDNNYLIKNRNLSIYIDDIFVDTLVSGKKSKTIKIRENDKLIVIKSGDFTSNIIDLSRVETSLKIGSKIDNATYFFIYILFFLSLILYFLKLIHEYIGIAMILPMSILVYFELFRKKGGYVLYVND